MFLNTLLFKTSTIGHNKGVLNLQFQKYLGRQPLHSPILIETSAVSD